jgi:hypothetical protein
MEEAAPPPPDEGFQEREAEARKTRRKWHCSLSEKRKKKSP